MSRFQLHTLRALYAFIAIGLALTIWPLAFALPVALNEGLDTYATDTLFACVLGLLLVPLALSWKYLFTRYFTTDMPSHSQS